jgi:pyruvate kinase
VRQLKEAIRDRGQDVPVIAKIEKPQAVKEIEAILEAADGVMVARGDLGVEMPESKVPVAQKQIIARANRAGKPVITATQMLESMVEAAKPTRAEASDVANAILDGSDAVMLSQETAIGQYPVRAVETMARIAEEADAHLELTASDEVVQEELRLRATSSAAEAVAGAAFEAARRLNVAALIVFTHSGATARLVAQPRPQRPIFAMTPEETTYRRLALIWGVRAFRIPTTDDATELLRLGEEKVLQEKVLEPHQTVVMLSGRTGSPGTTNTLRVHVLGEG